MTPAKPANKGRQRLILLAIVLIFSIPFTASWVIYNFTDIGKGDAKGSYGQLILPPVLLPDVYLSPPLATGDAQKLYGRWHLLYITANECGPPCRKRLHEMQELRISLGKDTGRVQLLLGSTSAGSENGLSDFLEIYSGKRILLFRHPVALYPFEQDELYLIDPLGNLMMRYSSGSSVEGILQDLKRLLRYSRIG
jgi:hypothetical protein